MMEMELPRHANLLLNESIELEIRPRVYTACCAVLTQVCAPPPGLILEITAYSLLLSSRFRPVLAGHQPPCCPTMPLGRSIDRCHRRLRGRCHRAD